MDPVLIAMAIIRLISSLLELTAAFLFLKFNDIKMALRINAFLGLLGPLIFLGVSFLGIFNLVDKLPFKKLVLIFIGVILIVIGTTSSK